MLKIFKKPKRTGEVPQLVATQRRADALPGTPPGRLAYAVYDEMERDPMVQTALTVKRLGVLSGEYSIEGEPERVAFVKQALARMEGSERTILSQAMDAFSKGWSIQEIVWEEEDGKWWPSAVRSKDPSLFGTEVDEAGRITGLTLQLPGEPSTALDRSRFILFLNRSNYGRRRGRSDLDAAWRHWVIKGQLISAWKEHMERFAMPTVIGKYKRGTANSESASLLSQLVNLQRNSAMVMPDDTEVVTLGGDKEASTGFQEAIEFHNREIARSILGQTLTTDEGRRVGSLALGKVHLQVLVAQLDALRHELADTVMTEQFIRPIIEANFGPGSIPKFVFTPVSLNAFSTGLVE